MPRRPPFTVVAYVALVLAFFVAALIGSEGDPGVVLAAAVVAPFLAGLLFRIRIVWIFVTAFQVLNLTWVLAGRGPWWSAATLVVGLVLLLSPPTRGYFRRDPLRARKGRSRAGRVVRLSAAALVAVVLGVVLYLSLFRPDPVSGDLAQVRSDRPGLRVLFVGNSLTFYNGMTGMVRDLAEGDRGAPPVFVVQYARGGSSLEEALDDDRLTELLDGERWNAVVLQEQSMIPSRPPDLKAHMLPAATALDRLARQSGARTVLFETWGYEHGDGDDDSYQFMQARLISGYHTVGSRLSSLIAPVGSAWQEAVNRRPGLDFWKWDGRHPTSTGSYLAACVFYALLTGRDPAQSSFTADLDPADAHWLGRVANREVRRHYPLAAR
jgi:hypothetical protein